MIRNHCDSKLQNFCAQFFNFKIIFALSILENVVTSNFFTFAFTFCCAMQRRDPVGEILRPTDGVKDSAVSCIVSIWDYSSDRPLRVHPSAVINILPVSSALKISTTLQIPEGGVVLITMSSSSQLVGVGNGWLNSWVVPTRSVSPEGVHDSFRELSRPSSFDRQWDLIRLFCHQIYRGGPKGGGQ